MLSKNAMLLNRKREFSLKSFIEISQKAYKQRGYNQFELLFRKKMQSPTEEELEESIKELTEYKNRLEKEVVNIANKLKMPQEKINAIIKSHSELNQIKIILSKLNKQKEIVSSNLIP